MEKFEIKERQYIIDFKLDIGDSCYFFAECNEDNNINFVRNTEITNIYKIIVIMDFAMDKDINESQNK